MAADGGAVALGGLAGELELLLQGQHRLGVGELQPARTPGEGGVVEVERGIHIAPLMQLLELIEQGIELIVEGRDQGISLRHNRPSNRSNHHASEL